MLEPSSFPLNMESFHRVLVIAQSTRMSISPDGGCFKFQFVFSRVLTSQRNLSSKTRRKWCWWAQVGRSRPTHKTQHGPVPRNNTHSGTIRNPKGLETWRRVWCQRQLGRSWYTGLKASLLFHLHGWCCLARLQGCSHLGLGPCPRWNGLPWFPESKCCRVPCASWDMHWRWFDCWEWKKKLSISPLWETSPPHKHPCTRFGVAFFPT